MKNRPKHPSWKVPFVRIVPWQQTKYKHQQQTINNKPIYINISSYHHVIVSSYHYTTILYYHHNIVPSYHIFMIPSYHHIIISSYHHIIISSCRSYHDINHINHTNHTNHHHIIVWSRSYQMKYMDHHMI